MITIRSSKNKFYLSDNSVKILKVTKNNNLPIAIRNKYVLLVSDNGFDSQNWGLIASSIVNFKNSLNVEFVFLDSELSYLDEEDVIVYYPNENRIKVSYRKKANANHFLITENCNSFCIMCSQPPRNIDDSYLIKEILKTIPLINKDTVEIGITGGEPTLVGDGFFKIIEKLKIHLPNTAVHILSNGRNFSDVKLGLKLAEINHSDLMLGIPLYADYSQLHDFIVQAPQAFDDTIRGIINLKRCSQKVEIRVVIHKQNYSRLPEIANFIQRNLMFVDHVAFMGLEIIGFARANLNALWIDPYEYMEELEQAVAILDKSKIPTSVYNLPLCLLGNKARLHTVKSISDWKQEYIEECNHCSIKNACAGFFVSSKFKFSNFIKAIDITNP